MDVILQLLGTRLLADFLAQHSDVAAEGRQSDGVFGLTAANAPNFGRVADGEPDDPDAETLRHREVTGLMNDD